jgi:cephalosporin hydroxylase
VDRSFSTFFTTDQLPAYQRGVMNYRYRGLPCHKSPIDLAIYLALIDEVRPKTIIEVGTKFGGSAKLFRDFAKVAGADTVVVSIDVNRPELELDGILFLEGNVLELPTLFEREALYGLPRPWLVIEDSAHTAACCQAALHFFAEHLRPGEWLVMEDGVLSDLGLTERYNGGPNRAIAEFFSDYPDIFAIGSEYCDMFGRNATYNPNGYLRRTETPFGCIE